jgi:pyruvate/2-oxoglutarate/acetoin dehydrogenase E1 component
MELTKTEQVIIVSMIATTVGIEACIGLIGEETVKKLDEISNNIAMNTTPNEIELAGTKVIKKLVDSILETEKKGE